MKRILLVAALLFPSMAFAVPQSGVTYTYQVAPSLPGEVYRLPDKVWIPLHATGATYETTDASGVATKTYVADPENEDAIEYKKWLKAGNKPAAYVPPPPPAPDEKKELQKQLDILELKAKIKALQNGGN